MLAARQASKVSIAFGAVLSVLGICGMVAAALALCCFPAAGLSFSAGALFGPWRGLALVVGGCYLAAILILILARGVLRGTMRRIADGEPWATPATVWPMAARRSLRKSSFSSCLISRKSWKKATVPIF